nr:hypothetical protein [Tanacetum cinerariifolium]
MGNIVFPLLALEVRMGHGLPLSGSSDDLTIGIDDLLNQLEQFEPSVPFFYEGSSLEGRGGTDHTVIINFLDKFITAGKNKGEGLLPSSSVDVTTRKGLVDMFVQGVNLRSMVSRLDSRIRFLILASSALIKLLTNVNSSSMDEGGQAMRSLKSLPGRRALIKAHALSLSVPRMAPIDDTRRIQVASFNRDHVEPYDFGTTT